MLILEDKLKSMISTTGFDKANDLFTKVRSLQSADEKISNILNYLQSTNGLLKTYSEVLNSTTETLAAIKVIMESTIESVNNAVNEVNKINKEQGILNKSNYEYSRSIAERVEVVSAKLDLEAQKINALKKHVDELVRNSK